MILEVGGLLLLTLTAAFLLVPLIRAALRQRRMHAWPQVTSFVLAHRSRVVQNAHFPEHQVRVQLAGRGNRGVVRLPRPRRHHGAPHTRQRYPAQGRFGGPACARASSGRPAARGARKSPRPLRGLSGGTRTALDPDRRSGHGGVRGSLRRGDCVGQAAPLTAAVTGPLTARRSAWRRACAATPSTASSSTRPAPVRSGWA